MTPSSTQGTPPGASPAGAPHPLPERFGRYEVAAYMGQGSFGPIYRGRHPTASRDVVIKTCTAGNDALHRRFVGEAETARSLEHERIVHVWDFGTDGSTPYLVEELLGGRCLDEAIASPDEARPIDRLAVLVQVAEALSYAHGRGIVHRGLQPGTVRLLDDGRVKVHDFGIARLASEESQLTQKGVTLGTAAYLAPEQVRGADVDLRADVFSFGVLAYELLAERRPFRGRTLSALVYQILYKPPAPLDAAWPDAPADLGGLIDLVARCLEKEQDNRPTDAQRILDELQGLQARIAPEQLTRLRGTSGPAGLDGTLPGSSDDPLSRSMISRAAAAAQRGAADAADRPPSAQERTMRIDTATRAAAMAQQPGGAATASAKTGAGSAKTGASGEETIASPSDSGASRREPTQGKSNSATQPVVPPLEASQDSSEAEPSDELADTAEEISQLVAQGELHKALEHLEETMGRHGETVATDDALPTVALRHDELQPAGSVVPTFGSKDILELDQEMIPTARIGSSKIAAAEARVAKSARKSSAKKRSKPRGASKADGPTLDSAPLNPSPLNPSPAAAAPGAAGGTPPPLPAAGSVAPPPAGPAPAPPAAGPDSRGASAPGAAPRKGPLAGLPLLALIGAAAVVGLLVLVGLGMVLFSGDDEAPEPEDVVVEAVAPKAPPTPAPAPAETSGLAIDAHPWAYVREVTDSEGFVHDLPVEATTPFFLALPPGEYRVVLEREGSAEPRFCEAVEVGADAIARCVATFDEPPSTEDFFRDSGWWR